MGNCVYRIPICGGFCAPTQNPDTTCLKHVSNEFTAPGGPMLFKKKDYIETSRCCRFFGRFGVGCVAPYRGHIMMFGMCGNLVMLVFCFVAFLGTTTSTSMIKRAYWAKGVTSNQAMGTVTTFLGVNMRYDEVDCTEANDEVACQNNWKAQNYVLEDGLMTRAMSWSDEELCNVPADVSSQSQAQLEELQGVATACESCASCDSYSTGMLFLNIITQFPTAATNCQRSTVYGDINCQATMGFVSNVVGFFSGMLSLQGWGSVCYKDSPKTMFGEDIEWNIGIGFVFLLLATIFKTVDAMLHCVVPTPERTAEEVKTCTELHDYLIIPIKRAAEEGGTAIGKARQ